MSKELLEELLQAREHKDVVNIIYKYIGKDYSVVEGTKWMVISPVTGGNKPTLSAHTDTVSKEKPTRFVYNGDTISNFNGVLGADDRAGIWIICKLLEYNCTDYNFVIFDEEEIGGIGSREFVQTNHFDSLAADTSCWIGLDRRGTNEVATYGLDNYELIESFKDNGWVEAMGSFTDVVNLAEYSGIACVNLSVGYNKEHSKNETLNIRDMKNTFNLLLSDIHKYLDEDKYVVEENYISGCGLNHWAGVYDKNSGYGFDDYDYPEPVFCEVCGQHAPVYDLGWGFVCGDCLPLTNEYKDK